MNNNKTFKEYIINENHSKLRISELEYDLKQFGHNGVLHMQKHAEEIALLEAKIAVLKNENNTGRTIRRRWY